METSQNTLQSYVQSLLTLMGEDGSKPLGMALRWDTQTSKYNLPADRVLQAMVKHALSPQTVAQQFMTELGKCKIAAVISLVETLRSDHSVSPSEWAAAVWQEIKQNDGNMTPLTELAEHYLNALIIPFANPTGKRTPASSQPNTPNLTASNNSLLEAATARRSQTSLKQLVLRRDGTDCLITKNSFVGKGRVHSHCAHIVPFSVCEKTVVHTAIEMFTGYEVTAGEVVHLINHPSNAIVIEPNAHISMDQYLAWGIEAILDNDRWKYYYRVVRPDDIYGPIRLNDGDEIIFGGGSEQNDIALPDGRLCNLHLAIARVFAASGAAEVLKNFMDDWTDDQGANNLVDAVSRQLMLISCR